MKCFYHIDDDGKCAAAIVRKFADKDKMGTYIPMNYGWEFPLDKIDGDEEIYIVDFSIEPEVMTKLLDITSNIIWLDHHISAIKKYDGYPFDIPGIRMVGVAGCLLTWKWFADANDDIPKAVNAIAKWDVWEFKEGDETFLFHYGFETMGEKDPTDDITWYRLLDPDVTEKYDRIHDTGKIVYTSRHNRMRDYCKGYGYCTIFEGYMVYVVNQGLMNSFDFVVPDRGAEAVPIDIYIGVVFTGKRWSYSLRSVDPKKVNVAELAEKYGGGGHAGAAGFHSDKFLFDPKETTWKYLTRKEKLKWKVRQIIDILKK